jgi:hypothetical protein
VALASISNEWSRIRRARGEQERAERSRDGARKVLEESARVAQGHAGSYVTDLEARQATAIARLDAQRRYWKEVEERQTRAALSALSLLAESINTAPSPPGYRGSVVVPRRDDLDSDMPTSARSARERSPLSVAGVATPIRRQREVTGPQALRSG